MSEPSMAYGTSFRFSLQSSACPTFSVASEHSRIDGAANPRACETANAGRIDALSSAGTAGRSSSTRTLHKRPHTYRALDLYQST